MQWRQSSSDAIGGPRAPAGTSGYRAVVSKYTSQPPERRQVVVEHTAVKTTCVEERKRVSDARTAESFS